MDSQGNRESEPVARPHRTLAGTLEGVLASEHEDGPSIGEIVAAVGDKGFGLLLMVLSLPSALPVPAPGYSTPFGIVIALIALQMLVGRHTLWLPRRLNRIRIKPSLADKMLPAAAKFLRKIERFIRPRQQWVRTRAGLSAIATVILVMASLMILPIPLTNTFPAMVIFLVGAGLTEEDGLLALAAFAVGCVAVLLYGYIIFLLITQGPEAVDGIKDWIKARLGMGAE